MLTPHSPFPPGVYLVLENHAQAGPFLRYCLDLLSFRLLAEDKSGSVMQNMLHKVSNPTAGWLAEILEFALRTGHAFHDCEGGTHFFACLVPAPGFRY